MKVKVNSNKVQFIDEGDGERRGTRAWLGRAHVARTERHTMKGSVELLQY